MRSFWESKYEEVKQFVRKHQVPLACSATAVATYVVFRDHGAYKEGVRLNRDAMLEHLEHLALHDFITAKDLQSEFESFRKEFGI